MPRLHWTRVECPECKGTGYVVNLLDDHEICTDCFEGKVNALEHEEPIDIMVPYEIFIDIYGETIMDLFNIKLVMEVDDGREDASGATGEQT